MNNSKEFKELMLTEQDRLHIKNIVEAMKHFENRDFTVYGNSRASEYCHCAGFKGVEIYYAGSFADKLAKSIGVDIDKIEANEAGYKEFMVGDIEYHVHQLEV